VYPIDLACDELPLEAGRFDAILFGDVLEHLLDPLAALDWFRSKLGGTGWSVPNPITARRAGRSPGRGIPHGTRPIPCYDRPEPLRIRGFPAWSRSCPTWLRRRVPRIMP
jgi:hypothetical protein